MKKITIFAILASLLFIIRCGDSPLEYAIDYEPNLGPNITLGNATGSIYSGYVLRTGSISFDFSQDKAGYYNIQVLDSTNTYVSGTGLNAWIDYTTANQVVSITVYSPNSASGHDTYFNGSGNFTIRVRSRDMNNYESSGSKSFTVAPLNSVIVTGAGTALANGCYLRITSFTFLRPSTQYTVYYQKSDNSSYYISVDDSMPGTHIHYGGSSDYIEYYYTYYTSIPPNLVSANWNVGGSGSSPVPTFYLNN